MGNNIIKTIMKFTYLMLLGIVSAYDESEGPTMPDNGEDEESVVFREADVRNGAKASGWTNPLGWADSGEDDESVILQLHQRMRLGSARHQKTSRRDMYDGDENTVSQYDDMEQHKKFDWGVDGIKSAYGLHQRVRKGKDAYDGDADTVSQYDDMEQHKKFDWGQNELMEKRDDLLQESAQIEYLMNQHRSRKDAYDGDNNTVSQYDDMEQHKKFDWGVDGVKSAYGLHQRVRKGKDAYDGDADTVSQYDDM